MNKQELLNKLEAIKREYKGIAHNAKSQENYSYAFGLCDATARIINLVKDDEDVQPEHSRIESVYQCGKKPHWNVGDTLAYYEFYSGCIGLIQDTPVVPWEDYAEGVFEDLTREGEYKVFIESE